MAELDIGQHCYLEVCRQLDFLPIRCDGCGHVFCKTHSVKDTHNCSLELISNAEKGGGVIPTYLCDADGCGKNELLPVLCPKCHHNYCMQHRHAQDHNCKAIEIKPKYMENTAKHIQGIIEAKPRRKEAQPKSQKSMETSAKVALMKMKMSAKGESSIPTDSRVYLHVLLPSKDELVLPSAAYIDVFVSKLWFVGRSVDAIAALANIRNENNKTNAPQLRLMLPNSALTLDMESKMIDLLESRQIYNGNTLELRYFDPDLL